jgi:hypothetical protein
MSELHSFALAHKQIFWDVSSSTLERMDDVAILERFWCYGNWEEYKSIEKIIGQDRAKKIFVIRAYMPRTNLREETINLFTHYYHVTPPANRTLSRAI